MQRSKPLLPPSVSELNKDRGQQRNNASLAGFTLLKQTFRHHLNEVKKLLVSKAFMLLFVCFGLGLGVFNALLTLTDQIICVRGYTSDDAGLMSGLMIVFGTIGSLVFGFIAGKTKKFEEIAKLSFCTVAVASVIFAILLLNNNDHGTLKAFVYIIFCIVGFFGLPLLPICMEMSVECVYPIGESICTGFLFISGQLFGIILILAYPAIGKTVPIDSFVYNNTQTCVIISNSTTTASTKVTDFTNSLYLQLALIIFTALGFTLFYKCPYLRLKSEKETE
jgi:FLVCR family MFS transporter 7